MPAGKGPLRFRRYAYKGQNSKGDEPRWHRPAYNYDPKEIYLNIVALCGYELGKSRSIRGQLDWSKAVKPKGQLCSKCEKKAETS